jgi:hypothetical protein
MSLGRDRKGFAEDYAMTTRIKVYETGSYEVQENVAKVIEVHDFASLSDFIRASLATKAASLLVSTASGTWAELDNSAASDGQIMTYDSSLAKKMAFKGFAGGGGVVTLTNNSGSSRALGDVVVFDKSAASSFTTTTVQGDRRAWGVVKDTTIANGAAGLVAIGSTIETVKVTGNVAIGQTLITSTSAGYAMANGGGKQTGIIGYALTAYTGGANGTVQAFIVPDLSAAAAEVVVEGVQSSLLNNTGVSLQCGTNANRLVIAFCLTSAGTSNTWTAGPLVAGAAMTQVGSGQTWADTNAAANEIRVYKYLAPGTGSLTVTTPNISGNQQQFALFVSMSGVNQTTPTGTVNGNTITGASPSVNCTDALPGDLVLGMNGEARNSQYTSLAWTGSGANQTNRIAGTASTYAGGILDSKPATSATETMSWTVNQSIVSKSVSIPIKPA